MGGWRWGLGMEWDFGWMALLGGLGRELMCVDILEYRWVN